MWVRVPLSIFEMAELVNAPDLGSGELFGLTLQVFSKMITFKNDQQPVTLKYDKNGEP